MSNLYPRVNIKLIRVGLPTANALRHPEKSRVTLKHRLGILGAEEDMSLHEKDFHNLNVFFIAFRKKDKISIRWFKIREVILVKTIYVNII